MDINDLTLGQVAQLRSLFEHAPLPTKPLATPPAGRYVVVVDRGWIYAGDLSTTPDGYYLLSKAVMVFGWQGLGLPRVLTEWKSDKVDLRTMAFPVEIPSDAVVYRIPVPAGWGDKS